jgi:fructokinase
MEASVDLLVVGESLVDYVNSADGSRRSHPGGSPFNVAVGLARLGRDVGLLTRYGSDPDGELLAAHLKRNGVTLLADPLDSFPTSVAEARLDAKGAATYEFRLHSDIPTGVTVPDDLRAVHTGSIGAFVEPSASHVRELLVEVRDRVTISYDPNCRPTLMGTPDNARPAIEGLIRLADVVKVSTDDILWLYPARTHEESAREWLSFGPAIVVVTRSAEGSWGVCAQGEVARDPFPVKVVDTVGAGDAFQSGLLDSLFRRGLLGREARAALRAIDTDTLGAVLDDAGLVSAMTVGRAGADPPTAAEIAAGRRGAS